MDQWVNDTELLREFLMSMSRDSELTPLAKIFCNYAAVRALNAWLGPQGCKRCEQCVRFLGYDMHSPAVREVCSCALSIAYRHALKDPVTTIEDAKKVVRIISTGVQKLAQLPELAEKEHQQLQAAIHAMLQENSSPKKLLETGLQIYGKTGDWLHVGLPEILDSIKHGAEVSKETIDKVYQKWRAFGQKHHQRVAEAAASSSSPVVEDPHLGLFKKHLM